MGESQHMLLNSTQLHLEEGEFLHQKALGKNRTHDQDPPSSSLDRYFFDLELQYKLQYLYIIPLAAFKIIEMTQQLDSKEFHFCFKILEKKNMKNSEVDMRVICKAASCVEQKDKNKKTTKRVQKFYWKQGHCSQSSR